MAQYPCQQIITDSKSVKDVFRSGYFEAPVNQREYSWGKDQLEKIWDDLVFTVKKNNEHSIGHFLGAIVIIGKNSSHDNSRWSVIDGQQRLTTLTILTQVLLLFVEQHVNERKSKEWLESSLKSCFYDIGRDGTYLPRMVLNRGNEFYSKSLLDYWSFGEKNTFWNESVVDTSEVQKRLKDAFIFFNKKIEKYIDSSDLTAEESLKDLTQGVTEDFYFLVVRTEEIWMAYRLFETLNERGLDLSQADLIKNVLLQNARECGANIVDLVSKNWNLLKDNYEAQSKRLELPQIIQFSYTYRDSLVKKDDIFDRVSIALRQGKHDPYELAVFFEEDSRNWCAFLHGDLSKWTDSLSDIQHAILHPLWKSHCVPFIMAVINRYENDIPSLEKCLILCEHYLFRQGLICNDPVSSLQEFFSKAALKVKVGESVDEVTAYFRMKSSDDLFLESFRTASVKNMKQAFYVLWKIENSYSTVVEFRPCCDPAAHYVEYILPKKPDPSWGGIEKKESFSAYLNRIGNIIALPTKIKNYVKNKPMLEKMSNNEELDYQNSGLSLPVEICEKYAEWSTDSKWGFDSISRRQNLMTEKYALKVWSL